jgi:hypothetical protein
MKGEHEPFVAVAVSVTAPRLNIRVSDQAVRRALSGEPKRGRDDSSDEKRIASPFLSSALRQSIDTSNTVGPRDQTIFAVIIFTAARVGAEARLTLKSLKNDGTQCALHFSKKGGKSRENPARHDVEQTLLSYINAAGISEGPSSAPPPDRSAAVPGRSGPADFNEELNV